MRAEGSLSKSPMKLDPKEMWTRVGGSCSTV